MQEVITKGGKIFAVNWLGLSPRDNAVRFETVDNETTLPEAFMTFNDPNETAELTHVFDEKRTVYDGYTVMRSIEQLGARIVVALRKGATE